MSDFPALTFTNKDRNDRLYKFLTDMGLYTAPIFYADTDEIDYIAVSTFSRSESVINKSSKDSSEAGGNT